MSSHVDIIKERLSITDVLSSYIKLEQAGTNFKARCPFHNEKTPSFFISPDRGTYYCFGCGLKGDIFSFVEQFEGTDFRGALKMLAEKAGVKLDYESRAEGDEKEKLYLLMESATKLYERTLAENPKALEYLQKRGLTEKTIKEWRIGYSPDDWHFTEMSLKKNAGLLDLEKAGLIKKGEKGYYDRFRGRIMFPLFDTAGRVIAFSARAFARPDDEAKYLNSPETPIFNKSSVLYGLHKAKASIREKDYAILVEGQVDLLMSHQAGFANTVATSGTSLTDHHLNLIKRFSNRIMVAYDADGAGWRASKRAWQMALALGVDIKIAEIPDGFDPADLILKDRAAWSESLKNSKHIIDLALEKILVDKNDRRLFGKRVYEEVLPYIASIPGNIDQSHYVKRISELGDITEVALWQDLAKMVHNREYTEATDKLNHNVLLRRDSIERKILSILYWQEKQAEPKVDCVKIRRELEQIIGSTSLSQMEATLKDSHEDIIFEAEAYYSKPEILQKDSTELLQQLEIEHLKEKFAMKMKEIVLAEKAGDIAQAQILLMECQGISKKMQNLKNNK
ncbi:MAG: DNA primase [bacterium]